MLDEIVAMPKPNTSFSDQIQTTPSLKKSGKDFLATSNRLDREVCGSVSQNPRPTGTGICTLNNDTIQIGVVLGCFKAQCLRYYIALLLYECWALFNHQI